MSIDTAILGKEEKRAFWLEIMGVKEEEVIKWKNYQYIRSKNPITSDRIGRPALQRVYLPESIA